MSCSPFRTVVCLARSRHVCECTPLMLPYTSTLVSAHPHIVSVASAQNYCSPHCFLAHFESGIFCCLTYLKTGVSKMYEWSYRSTGRLNTRWQVGGTVAAWLFRPSSQVATKFKSVGRICSRCRQTMHAGSALGRGLKTGDRVLILFSPCGLVATARKACN